MRRLALFLLGVALFAGWQKALLHPLEHVDQHGGLVHLALSHSDSHGGQKSTNPSDKLCSVLTGLTACVPEAHVWELAPESGHVPLLPRYGAPRVADAPPFLSQGPPALL